MGMIVPMDQSDGYTPLSRTKLNNNTYIGNKMSAVILMYSFMTSSSPEALFGLRLTIMSAISFEVKCPFKSCNDGELGILSDLNCKSKFLLCAYSFDVLTFLKCSKSLSGLTSSGTFFYRFD